MAGPAPVRLEPPLTAPPAVQANLLASRLPAGMLPWLRTQSVNVNRHAAALRPFRRDEFGTGAESPTDAHIQAVNGLIGQLRQRLLALTATVTDGARQAENEPSTQNLARLLTQKERAHDIVRAVERVWDFYFELFGQRQTRYGSWFLACDRIALDCYQYIYLGLGVARSIPTPPPFSYMRTGFSPATFRRAIPLRRLGQQLNPFPLIQLPYHRLVNPWTLGAVLHEVSHNLQNDLGLERAVPARIARRLLQAGCGRFVASVWTRWNRETFADLSGLLLGGPAVVASLMDVIGRSPHAVVSYSATGPHPTPYARTLISVELLRRMGFGAEAEDFRRTWMRLYPNPHKGNIPRPILDSLPEAKRVVVDAVCYDKYPSLGNKSLSDVIRFQAKEQKMIEEAARRLATGTDPGVIPERFLIGASRFALEQRLARPGAIATSFYRELARR